MSTDYRTRKRFSRAKRRKKAFDHYRERCARRTTEQLVANAIPSMETIFHHENLIHTFDKLQSNCGPAPGPDGITYDDVGRREMSQVMRELSTEVLSGRYQPSTARSVHVAKANGRGHRTLCLRSITYRVVAAALAEALGKYFEPMFLPGSHGYRPKLGMQTMLLAMESMIIEQQRYAIAQDDIRNAFGNVSVDHVMGILRQNIDDAKLLETTEKILRGNPHEERTTGIDQGSPLSPLILNVALHHSLDVPFGENAELPPWLRYADNLVYLCQSVHEGQTAIQAAKELLTPIGMTLKGDSGNPVDLREGKANILGFDIHWVNGQIQYGLTEEAWDSLAVMLSGSHMSADPGMASHAIRGWIDSWAPAFEGKKENPILDRILQVGAEIGYREITRSQLKQYLQSSRDKWLYRRRLIGRGRVCHVGNPIGDMVTGGAREPRSSAYHGLAGHLDVRGLESRSMIEGFS